MCSMPQASYLLIGKRSMYQQKSCIATKIAKQVEN